MAMSDLCIHSKWIHRISLSNMNSCKRNCSYSEWINWDDYIKNTKWQPCVTFKNNAKVEIILWMFILILFFVYLHETGFVCLTLEAFVQELQNHFSKLEEFTRAWFQIQVQKDGPRSVHSDAYPKPQPSKKISHF